MIDQEKPGDLDTEILFPLTLTLSLKEREQLPTRYKQTRSLGFVSTQRMILPLLRGEGRGEGKRSVINPAALKRPSHCL